MTVSFNDKTMTFVGLGNKQKQEIISLCKDIIYLGKIDYNNIYVAAWMERYCKNNEHKLMTYSIAMPQRLLLSVID